jgi:emp24/gp25L/p24 family/GOLD
VWFACAALVALLAHGSHALKIKMEPYATECVTEGPASEGDRVCVRPPGRTTPPRLHLWGPPLRSGCTPNAQSPGEPTCTCTGRLCLAARSRARRALLCRGRVVAFVSCARFALVGRPDDSLCWRLPRRTGSFVGGMFSSYKYFRNFFDFEIKMEDGTSLFSVRNRQDAKFDFVMPRSGRFQACIRNYGRQPTDAAYSSYIGHREDHGKLTKDQLSPVRDAVFQLRQTLRSILEEQRYQENRDRAMLATTNSSGRRAVFWAVIEALVLVTISVAQVYLLKRLFEGASSKLPRSAFSMQPSRLQRPTWGV